MYIPRTLILTLSTATAAAASAISISSDGTHYISGLHYRPVRTLVGHGETEHFEEAYMLDEDADFQTIDPHTPPEYKCGEPRDTFSLPANSKYRPRVADCRELADVIRAGDGVGSTVYKVNSRHIDFNYNDGEQLAYLPLVLFNTCVMGVTWKRQSGPEQGVVELGENDLADLIDFSVKSFVFKDDDGVERVGADGYMQCGEGKLVGWDLFSIS